MKKSIFLLGLTCGLASASRADVIYSLRYMEPGEKIAHTQETRVLVSETARLREDWMGDSQRPTKELELTQIAQKRIVVMDTKLKIYHVKPFPEEGNPAEQKDFPKAKIVDLGNEEVLGFKTRHFQFEFQFGPELSQISLQDCWVAPPASVRGFPQTSFAPRPVPKDVDAELWRQMSSGLPVRTRISQPDKTNPKKWSEVYTQEISSLSIVQIDPAYFEIPGDYKELSKADYDRARRRKLDADYGIHRGDFPT